MDSTETAQGQEPGGIAIPVASPLRLPARLQATFDTFATRLRTESGLLLSLALVLLVRVVELRMPKNPDGFHKWDIARDMLAGQLPRAAAFDHHAARWAINLPVAAFQALLGSSAIVAYVPILLFDVLQGVLTYFVGVALGSRSLGMIAVLLFSVVPKMTYLGSELLPTVFESSYALAACYAVLRAADEPKQRWLWVSLGCSCLAYLAKETTVFFLPGLVLGLFLLRRNIRECVAYTVGFFSFIGLETLFYRVAFGMPYGRLSIIRRHHLGNAKLSQPVESVGELFERYLHLSSGFNELFYVALLITLTYPWWRIEASRSEPTTSRGLQPKKYLVVLLTCWSYFFCNTFALKSLNPVLIAQPINERYLVSALPFLALLVAGFLITLPKRLPLSLSRQTWAALALSLCMTLLGASLYARAVPWASHPFHLTPRYQVMLRNALDDGVPIVIRQQGDNALKAVSSLFLDRDRAKRMSCSKPKDGSGKARVCIDKTVRRYHGLDSKALAKRLAQWAKSSHVEVATRGGFTAALRKP